MDLAHDSDTSGWWQVREIECQARRALEMAKPDNAEDDNPAALRVAYLQPEYFETKQLPPD